MDLCCGGCVLDGGLNCVGGKGGFPWDPEGSQG